MAIDSDCVNDSLRVGSPVWPNMKWFELLFSLAMPRTNIKRPAKALLARFGNLKTIFDAPLEELRTIPGIV